MSDRTKLKLTIGFSFVAVLLIVGIPFWNVFLSPLAVCSDKGGMYVEKSRSCVCSNDEGFFVCAGSESEFTSELIEKIDNKRPASD